MWYYITKEHWENFARFFPTRVIFTLENIESRMSRMSKYRIVYDVLSVSFFNFKIQPIFFLFNSFILSWKRNFLICVNWKADAKLTTVRFVEF